MSLRNTAHRIAPQLLKTTPKLTPPPPPRIEPQALNASTLANLARVVDSFAQAAAKKAPAEALTGLSNRGPGQAPLPEPVELPFDVPVPGPSASRQGYSEPVYADELPDVGNGTGVLTLNLANGRPNGGYRKAENRTEQAELIEKTGASILGFQEVDVGVNRSGNVNTALDVIRQVPGSESFGRAFTPAGDLKPDAPPGASKLGHSDGTTLFQTDEGTLVTGRSFTGDQHAIEGDAGADASYGNALYVGKPNQVIDAYTVVLPADPNNAGPPVDLAPAADGKITDAQRTALTQRNDQLRTAPGEPRTAVVARVVGEDGREKTIINTHLATSEHKELREAQLRYVTDIANAERLADPSREVVVLGDLNSSPDEAQAAFGGADLHRVVGGNKASAANYDQVWTSGGVTTDTSAQVYTEGVTDHQYAGYTVIR